MEYFVWYADPEGPYCALTSLQNVPDDYELREGRSRKDNFPSNAQFRMDPEFPNDIQLADCLLNLDHLIVASERLKNLIETFLADAPETHVEYLPVTILNHEGRVASDSYFIVNPLEPIDCIDQDESDLEWNPIDAEAISAVDELVLQEESIPENCHLFRLKYLPHTVLASAPLVEAIRSAKLTGIRFVSVDDFEY